MNLFKVKISIGILFVALFTSLVAHEALKGEDSLMIPQFD